MKSGILLINTYIVLIDEIEAYLERRVIRRWPAIILAASRIAKVKGRITILMVSIITMKGIRIMGVPIGTKWARVLEVFLKTP